MATQKKKKAVEAYAPVKEQKAKVEKSEMINIFSTTYGYWRYFVKNILETGGVAKFRFIKDADSYNGKIVISKPEVEKAKKVLAEYQKKNPDTKHMWK